MKLVNTSYGFFALTFVLLVIIFRLFQRRKYFGFILDHWIKKQSFFNKLNFFFFTLFWLLLAVSMFDIRGPEVKIDVNVPDQKTLILIDTSLSMLVEDVRPSRFERAIILARHFVKNTYSGQVGIVLFSDYQKKYVPFTDDIDLLDSRLAALSDSELVGGGSNINQALIESMAYLKEFNEDLSVGNILVITDGEDNEDFPIDEHYSNISLAIVGVGTLSGGPIPLRDQQKRFIGHKEEGGEKIISKLNENGIKSMSKYFPNFKYWIATNYALPTEEINQFFDHNFEKALRKDSLSSRPVLTHYFVISSVVALVMSLIFHYAKTYRASLMILLLLFNFSKASGDEKLIEKFKKENLTKEEKFHLASKLIEQKEYKSANTIYSELKVDIQKDSPENVFNYGTSLLADKRIDEGLEVLKQLKERKDTGTNFEKKINQNVLHFLAENKKEKEKKKNEENKDDEKNREQEKGDKKQNSSGSQSDKNQNGKNEGPQDNKSEQDNKKNKNDNGEENKKKSENEKSAKDDSNKEEKDEKDGPENLDQKKKSEKQRRSQVKISGLLKQLLNDDKNLQKRMFGTMNNEQGDMNKKKDW